MNCGHITLLVLCLLGAIGLQPALGENWPGWRGPTGQGISGEKDVPLKWSATDNILWKLPLPDSGNSSPIVWGDKIFITHAAERTVWPPQKLEGARTDTSMGGTAVAEKRSVICIDRTSGKILWERDVRYKESEVTHPTNPFCSATPVTDGERVIAHHGSAGLVCYDMDGELLWKFDHEKIHHIWGNASSPIIYRDLAIIWCGPGDRQFLLAVNIHTGEKVWQHDEPDGNSGESGKLLGSWATPIIVNNGEADQLIMPVPYKLHAFAPLTGKELWTSDGLGNYVYGSAGFENGFAVCGNTTFKIGPDGVISQGRIRSGAGKGPHTGVLVDGRLYVAGVVPACTELATGEEIWREQISERPGTRGVWSSMVYADGRLYFTDQRGTTLVLAAGPKYEVLAKNELDEHTNASLAISQGNIFVRTWKGLWCIGK